MLTSHFNIPEGAAMLEEKTYTLPQIAEVLGGASDRQSVLSKLKRRGIQYTATGRGKNLTITIHSIPDPFPLFCMEILHFDPRTKFEKVRNLFYYCFNDEEFFSYPDERKAAALEDNGHHISRQSIANYLKKLYDLGLFHLWLSAGSQNDAGCCRRLQGTVLFPRRGGVTPRHQKERRLWNTAMHDAPPTRASRTLTAKCGN